MPPSQSSSPLERIHLESAAETLRTVADLLEAAPVDGETRDLLGRLIYKVDAALREAGGDA